MLQVGGSFNNYYSNRMKSLIIRAAIAFLHFNYSFRTVLLSFTLSFFLSSTMAQESVNVTGGSAISTGGSVNYSIGQVVYTINNGRSGSVAEGIQQPYEISVVSGFQASNGTKILILAYPNPTTDLLTLDVRDFHLSFFTFRLYDLAGRLLKNEQILERKTSINMSNFEPATYFVKVFQENKEVKTFKIIKN